MSCNYYVYCPQCKAGEISYLEDVKENFGFGGKYEKAE